jgi:predicted DCC family thiol-disulfide oxidoreductase YuxK
MSTPFSLILFDGYCNLCSKSVQFVLKHDRKAKFRFASLQSEYGKAILQKHQMPTDALGTFVLIESDVVYTRSTAALRVVKSLSGMWPLLYVAIIIPRFLRDAIYALVARNRYRWFGKRDSCWLKSNEWKGRFLDSSTQ